MKRPTVRVNRDDRMVTVFVQRGDDHGCYLFSPDETGVEDRAEALFVSEFDPDQLDLFGGEFPTPEPSPDPYAGLGQDARRTAQQRDMIAAGQHPATRLRLADNEHTCGDCAHLVIKKRSGTWFKCALQLHDGQGLDIRKKWPACTAWADSSLTKDDHAE